jgi:hypothetical protein
MSKTIRRHMSGTSLATAMLLSGCATSTGGPQFSALDAVPSGKASIYLYRNSSMFAIGQAFTVNLDGRSVGQLYNASYLQVAVAPGTHTIEVAPGGSAHVSKLDITVEIGKTVFYEYDFVKGPFANTFFVGANIEPRDEAKALADLKVLKRAE